MILKHTLFISGFTARGQAYAQRMVLHGYMPEYTILFGPEKAILPGQIDKMQRLIRSYGDLFLPDLSIPLSKTIHNEKWPCRYLETDNINSSLMHSAIKELSPELIIYSGYGSQIVKSELLDLNIPFLHIHSGWLPEYKGSTTLYYSWINEQICGVSAIYLVKEIDNGPILLKKKYPPPPEGIDPDYIYDSAIRADVLIDVLSLYVKGNRIPDGDAQDDTGSVYYVIHPVLKHLARLNRLPAGV